MSQATSGILRAIISIILLVSATIASADQRMLVLTDMDRHTFFVMRDEAHSTAAREDLTLDELSVTDFEKALSRTDLYSYYNGKVIVGRDHRGLLVRMGDGDYSPGDMMDPRLELPNETSIINVSMDAKGALYVSYGGPGGFGVAYISEDLMTVIPRIEPVARALPVAASVCGNPFGSGLLMLSRDGAVYRWQPSAPKSSTFKVEKVLPEGSFDAMVDVGRKVFVLYKGRLGQWNGSNGVKRIEFGPQAQDRLRVLAPELQLASTDHFKDGAGTALPDLRTWPTQITRRSTALARREGAKNEAGPVSKNEFPTLADGSDEGAVLKYLETLREKMREVVVDQPQYTDALVDLWRDVLDGSTAKDMHKVLLVTGTTGSGKTFGAKAFAKFVMGSEDRVLEIDGTQFQAHIGSLDSHRLVGSSPGVQGADKFKGILPEFLSGKGKERNIIIINEFEHAAPWFHQLFKEMFDTGKMQGGDGKTYELGQSIVILTSNKGADKIYPRGRKGAIKRDELVMRLKKFDDKRVRDLFMEPDPNALFDKTKQFDPSILQRIDRAVVTGPVSFEGAVAIGSREAERLSQAKAERKNGYKLSLDKDVIEFLVTNFYSPEDGSRTIEKAVGKLFSDVAEQTQKSGKIESGAILNVSIEKNEYGEPEKLRVNRSDTKEPVRIAVPENPDDVRKKLARPEFRANLKSLEERMGRIVFGQAEAIKMSAKAIRSHVLNPQMKEPVFLLYLGSTGTGKTELAKAMAIEEFGDETRLERFDMGKVKNHGDMQNIFSPAKGFQGADSMGRFEQALNDFPEGAVLVFDEIGNMGGEGANAESKDSLLKPFYEMAQEGEWVSPSGKRYDLRKYRFVFTSNEGQEITQGIPSDDLRIAAWQRANKKEVLTELLTRQHGWPEAFVGRFKGNLTLFKPVVYADKVNVARKLVEQATRGLVQEHGLLGVRAPDEFYGALGESFYSHSQGARSIKGIAENAMTDLIGEAVLDAYEAGNVRKSWIELALTDNYAGKHMYHGVRPPKREVQLTVKLVSPTEVKTYQADLASDAPEKRLQSVRDMRRTAYHEAGHAIVNDPDMTGRKLDYLTIRGAGKYLGYARYADAAPRPNMTRNEAIAHIGMMLGGYVAERLVGFEDDSGKSDDFEKARRAAEQVITDMAITDLSLDIVVSNGRAAIGDPRVQAEISRLLHDARKYAFDRIVNNWIEYRLIAARLMRKGDVTGDTFDKLLNDAKSGAYRARQNRLNQAPKIDCESLFMPAAKSP